MTRETLMTDSDMIAYLRLAEDGKDGSERLRNLCRRHGLPHKKRAGRRWFRRSEVDQWLDAAHVGRRSRVRGAT